MKRPKIGTLKEQFNYLKKLRQMSIPKLRRLHSKTFDRTKWRLRLPGGIPRDFIEKRLWTIYCVRNYHYPPDHEVTQEFRKLAKQILSDTHVVDLSPEEKLRARAKEFEQFSWESIQEMELNEVDRWLALVGIYVDCKPSYRRQLLYEFYHKPKEDLPPDVVRNNRAARTNNRYVLRDLVIKNPRLCYDEFMKEYGDRMPTVSRDSFNSTRSALRRAGYKLPALRPGPKNPAIRRGKAAR